MKKYGRFIDDSWKNVEDLKNAYIEDLRL